MSDSISRQAAIDFIDKGRLCNPNEPRWSDNEVVNFLKSRPTAHPEPRWIPVTERLPEDGQRVLVTYDLVNSYPWVNILRYGKPMYEDKPCFYEADSEWCDVPYDGIVAWMPLPEVYRKETEDGEIH